MEVAGYLPYGFGGGATPRRLAGADNTGAGRAELSVDGGAERGGFGWRRPADGALAPTDPVGVATAVGAAAEGGRSSTGSPREIVEEVVVGAGAGRGAGLVVATGAACFGSSFDTAMTAAAVSETTIAPSASSAARTRKLGFFSVRGSKDARLRIGARPAPISFAV
jgi:hypothetical protein